VELLWRFLIGGTVVSIFAQLADVVRPKRRAGIRCRRRGRKAAAVDAAGAVLGAWALACFALVMRLVTWYSSAWILLAAALTWATVAVALWWTRWKHFPERWLSH
jgi:MFS family permease